MTRKPEAILLAFLILSAILGYITYSSSVGLYNKLVIEAIGLSMLVLFGILAKFPIDKSGASRA